MRRQAQQQLSGGLYEDAVDGFTACLQSDPLDVEALRGRAIARFQLKQWALAEVDFRKAKEIDPDDPETWVGLGVSLAIQNRIYPALDVLEGLISRRPDYIRGYIQLAQLYFRLGTIPKGRSVMEEALHHRPSPAERKLIESTLQDQARRDKQRYYRPDFEALNQRPAGSTEA